MSQLKEQEQLIGRLKKEQSACQTQLQRLQKALESKEADAKHRAEEVRGQRRRRLYPVGGALERLL